MMKFSARSPWLMAALGALCLSLLACSFSARRNYTVRDLSVRPGLTFDKDRPHSEAILPAEAPTETAKDKGNSGKKQPTEPASFQMPPTSAAAEAAPVEEPEAQPSETPANSPTPGASPTSGPSPTATLTPTPGKTTSGNAYPGPDDPTATKLTPSPYPGP